MHVLIVTYGSFGDVNPCIGLGRALKARGHDVTLITGGGFERLIRANGLDFIELYSVEQHQTWEQQLFQSRDPRRQLKMFFEEIIVGLMPRTYALVSTHQRAGETLLVANWFALGARMASEKLGVPLASFVLSAAPLRSAYANRRWPGFSLPAWLPPPLKRLLFRLSDHLSDRHLGKHLNPFRARLGLPPVSHLLAQWVFSPELILGFFPAWYAAPQPDWPSQLCLVGFPLYDNLEESTLSPELVDFLEAGSAPLVFVPGTGLAHRQGFFEESVEACRLLGCRGLLVSRYGDPEPPALPEEIRYIGYVPFSTLLPHVAALVHHGGVGTMAQALAAGVPQVVVPRVFDQLDNAYRLERLGVSQTMKARRYEAPRIATALGALLHDEGLRARSEAIRRRCFATPSFEEACNALERLHGKVDVQNINRRG